MRGSGKLCSSGPKTDAKNTRKLRLCQRFERHIQTLKMVLEVLQLIATNGRDCERFSGANHVWNVTRFGQLLRADYVPRYNRILMGF